MGQARQRGNFEARQALARKRNEALEKNLPPEPRLQSFKMKHGMRTLSTRLVMMGLLPPLHHYQHQTGKEGIKPAGKPEQPVPDLPAPV